MGQRSEANRESMAGASKGPSAAISTLQGRTQGPWQLQLCDQAPRQLVPIHKSPTPSPQGAAEWSGSEGWEVEVPLRLQVTGGTRGHPDLRLQLFRLRHGAPDELCRPAPTKSLTPVAGAVEFGSRAVTLLLASLLFPDSMPQVLRLAAGAGAASVVAHGVSALLPVKDATPVPGRLRRWRGLPPEWQSVQPAVDAAARFVHDYCMTAAALALLGVFWRVAHPSSYHLLQCVAAAFPVSVGYASTARRTARGLLTPAEVEAEWRRRHKWAARRVAHLLTDLHDRPPLAPLARLGDTLCLNIGLPMADPALTRPSAVAEGIYGWWTAPSCGEALQVWGSVAVPRRRSRKEKSPPPVPQATAIAPAPAAATALLPAVPGTVPAVAISAAPPHAVPHAAVSHPQSQEAAPPVEVPRRRWRTRKPPPPAPQPAATAPATAPLPAAAGMAPAVALSATPSDAVPHAAVSRPRAHRAAPPPQRPLPPPAAPAPEPAPLIHDADATLAEAEAVLQPHARPQQRAAPLANGYHHNTLPPPHRSRSPGTALPNGHHHAPALQGVSVPAAAAVAVDVVGSKSPDEVDHYPTSHLPTLRTQQELQLYRHKKESGEEMTVAGAAPFGHSGSRRRLDSASEVLDIPRGGVVMQEITPASNSLQTRGTRVSTSPASTSAVAQPTNAVSLLLQQSPSDWQNPKALAAAAAAEAQMAGASGTVAPLYGSADHAAQQAAPMTLLQQADLVARAGYLLLVFAPFLVLGVTLLLLALVLDWLQTPAEAPPARPVLPPPVGGVTSVAALQGGGVGDLAPGDAAATADVADAATGQRRPAVPGSGLAAAMRHAAYRLLLMGCRNSGAAFIKWGQWSATREDMFPPDLCAVLCELHDAAPTHSFAATRRQVEASLGATLEQLFISFEEKAVASGSIAQVHKAVMMIAGEARTVAVKVRHPGVATRIHQDFQLLKPLANATAHVRALKGLSLKQSVSQFSHTMTAQADLRVEAAHLRRFYSSFYAVRDAVTAPCPVPGCATEAVLVETFEPGHSVAKFMRTPSPHNTKIVALGVDAYLKMLLHDNFVHTDLHPGNIMVRAVDPPSAHRGRNTAAANTAPISATNAAAPAPPVTPDLAAMTSDLAAMTTEQRLQLILLDFGLAEELTPNVRSHFISFLHMISAGNGARAAHHMLAMGDNAACRTARAFTRDMADLFTRQCNIHGPAGIDVDAVLKAVLQLARRHEVSIDSKYAALVIGVCVIVGFATGLDPRVNLMDAATPCFLWNNLSGRVQGRLYS